MTFIGTVLLERSRNLMLTAIVSVNGEHYNLSQSPFASQPVVYHESGNIFGKNEQDIIEPFIRHNIKYFDVMIVLHNLSVDRTGDILHELSKEFENPIVVEDQIFGHFQGEKMTEAYRICQITLAADYIMFLDADEFIGRMDVEQFHALLADIPAGGVGYVPWKNFVLKPGTTDGNIDPPTTMRWRRAEETSWVWKIIIRADGKYDPQMVIQMGNHHVVRKDGIQIPSKFFVEAALFHFPVRSASQLVGKAITGWISTLSKFQNVDEIREATQWRVNYDYAISTGTMDEDELCLRSMQYDQHRDNINWEKDIVEETNGIASSRSYSTGERMSPLALVSKTFEQFVCMSKQSSREMDSATALQDQLKKFCFRFNRGKLSV